MQNHTLRPYLKLVAIAEDEATHEFLADIKFRDRDGNMRRVNLPLAELDNRKALVKTLTNLGAYFGTDQQANERALRKLIASKQKAKRINFAARVGWHNDGYHAFVLPNRVIGEARSKVPIRPPRLKSPGGFNPADFTTAAFSVNRTFIRQKLVDMINEQISH